MKARLLDDLPLATNTVDALEAAATRRGRRPVGTFDILAAVIDVDQLGDWAWVQVHTSPISVTEAHRFGDSDASTGGHWRNVPLTADATRALEVAARIADAYHLLPMPPGILALGLVWQADSGAARALLQGADLTHAQLLELLQDAVVGTRLMALDVAVGDAVAAHPKDSAGRQHAAMLDRQIEELFRAAAGAVPARGDRAYQLLTTAAVMLILVSRDRPLWERATVRTGISLEAYEANLRWACAHPTEKVGSRETQLDAVLAGIRLTDELSGAIEAAEGIASRLAGSEVPEVTGILAAVLLTVEGADARSGLAEPARLSLRRAVLQTVYGALVPDLDALVTEGRAAQATPTPATSDTPGQKPPGTETVGFNIGTFVGAFVVAVVGGVAWNVALVLAWLVRTVAARQRKKAWSQRLLPAVASAALVAAVALAVTAGTNFEDDRRAMEKVDAARQAIDRADLDQAARELGAAALLENQSVSIRVLASCVEWALGFKDIAVLEAQEALRRKPLQGSRLLSGYVRLPWRHLHEDLRVHLADSAASQCERRGGAEVLRDRRPRTIDEAKRSLPRHRVPCRPLRPPHARSTHVHRRGKWQDDARRATDALPRDPQLHALPGAQGPLQILHRPADKHGNVRAHGYVGPNSDS